MKLSKSILTAVVVGAALIGSSTSCTKERIEKDDEEREQIIPFCGTEGPQENVPYEDCPACGLG